MFFNKYIFGVLVVMVGFGPFLAFGAQIQGGSDYFLGKSDTVNENLYAAGGNISIAGNVVGDLVGAGGTINVTGNVSDEVITVGGTLNITGDIGGDLRATGGNILIAGKVNGDVAIAGGQVRIVPGVIVTGDVLVGGGSVIIEGDISGKTRIAGGDVRINGTIGGDLEVMAQRITLGSGAEIKGNFNYRSGSEAVIESGAVVGGETHFQKSTSFERKGSKKGVFAFVSFWIILKLLMFVLLGLIMVLVFKNNSRAILKRSTDKFWIEFLRGLIAFIVMPIVAVLAVVTLIGMPLGVIIGMAYIIFIILAKVFAGVIFGSWLHKILRKKESFELNWQIAVMGIIVLYVISWIPILGWLLCAVFFLASFGGLLKIWYDKHWINR
jgi:cytoskeletal protein CcmA (bactofilin family)